MLNKILNILIAIALIAFSVSTLCMLYEINDVNRRDQITLDDVSLYDLKNGDFGDLAVKKHIKNTSVAPVSEEASGFFDCANYADTAFMLEIYRHMGDRVRSKKAEELLASLKQRQPDYAEYMSRIDTYLEEYLERVSH